MAEGSLGRRLRSLMGQSEGGGLQRSQSFLEGAAAGGTRRGMSRSQSLRNIVAVNIGMRIRRSKKSSEVAAGGESPEGHGGGQRRLEGSLFRSSSFTSLWHGGPKDLKGLPRERDGENDAADAAFTSPNCKKPGCRPCIGGSSSERIAKQCKRQPCRRCGRPWSLDVTALVEEDEEQPASASEEAEIQVRSRSLTHLDSLEPTMLANKSSAPGPAAGSLPPADRLGASKRLSGSAELPSPSDRLNVPGEDSRMRRQKLTQSQVSSSEFFSVSFECLDDSGQEEFVPASKGTTLAEALAYVCSKRGIALSSVCVYQESVKRPLSIFTTDASRLGGKHLTIRAKEEKNSSRSLKGTSSSQGHSRRTSGSYRGYKAGKYFSTSTEETEGSIEGSKGCPSKTPSRQRWSAIFGNNKDTRMGTLSETLDNYSKNGIPAPFAAAECDEEDLLFLEDDWREVVGGDAWAAQLTERETQHQNAIWELLTTEVAYIRTLKVVTDLFLACLQSLQAPGGAAILTEVDTECLFSNIREIHAANLVFWRRHLLPMVLEVRALGASSSPRTLSPQAMKEGFLQFGEIFHPYIKYCGDQSRCQHYCREKIQENELFAAYLAWCETRKECNRLRLQDILVKPMQRLTKYSLLLKAIQRHSDLEDADSLEMMIKAVDEFVNGVNSTLRQRQEDERLRGVIARIEAYEVVETKDDEAEKMVKSYSDLDLTSPMPGCRSQQRRRLLMEADVRLKDHAASKVDVHVFLFTDILLVCKTVSGSRRAKEQGSNETLGDGGPGSITPAGSSSDLRMLKVIRQPFLVDRLVFKDSGNGLSFVYLNEFNLATAAFALSASEPKTIKSLGECLVRAREQFARAKAHSEGGAYSLLTAAPRMAASPHDGSVCCLCFREDSPTCPGASSRLSSLQHSHSGSVEMGGEGSSSAQSTTAAHSRGVSVETDLRGSSLSSDEGADSSSSTQQHRGKGVAPASSAPALHQGPAQPPSPRAERLCRSPNTLSVTYGSPLGSHPGGGQSLPNLLAPSPPPPSPFLLPPPRTPPTLVSQRGTSYPPPSPPRSLRRTQAVGRHPPPLTKTRHVAPSTDEASGVSLPPASSEEGGATRGSEVAGSRHLGGGDWLREGCCPPPQRGGGEEGDAAGEEVGHCRQ